MGAWGFALLDTTVSSALYRALGARGCAWALDGNTNHDMTELIPGLIDAGLHRIATQIDRLSQPAIRMRIASGTASPDSKPSSMLGGSPHLPVGFDWPRWRDEPLGFVGQINLADLEPLEPASLLPPSGILSFFYHPEQTAWGFDPRDRGSARVFWFSSADDLATTPPPSALPDHGRFSAKPLTFHPVLSLPPYQSRELREIGLSSDEEDRYFDFWEAWHEQLGESPAHQLLGHPTLIQDEMQLECQLVTNGIYCGNPEGYRDPRRAHLELHANEWQLLAQFDSDDGAGMMWGDAGMIYFWIRAADLTARDFEQTWTILQCS